MTAQHDGATGVRRVVALASLTLGGFAIGCSEFVAMGVLPEVARETLPEASAVDPDAAIATAAVFVWGYALGVVLGAPVLGLLSRRWAPGRFLAASLAAMALATLVTALVPGLGLVAVARVLSGIPHAAYFGVGAIVAAGLLGANHAARGVALVLGGLTVANVLGTPFGTLLGQATGWRAAYAIVALLFAVAAAGAFWSLRMLPAVRSPESGRRSAAVLATLRLWGRVAVYALVNAGLFAVVTFTAPVSTTLAGLPASGVAWVLLATGIGMTAGNYLGGAVADRSRPAAAVAMSCAVVGGLGALAGVFAFPALVYVGYALVGYALGSVTPFVQVALMRAVPTHPQLGSSMNSLCANAGSVIGAVAGGFALQAAGIPAVVVTGVVLSAVGLAAAALLARRDVEQAPPAG